MRHLKLLVAAAAIAALAAPAGAFAWQVTVRVHGAGMVHETTPRALMNCSVSPDGKSESSVTSCIAGTPGGVYNSGDVVSLRASVPTAAFNRGWRFLRWVDGNGSGQINCDPQEATGNHTSVDCQFQIWENLSIDLYFDDVEGPQDTFISSGPPSPTNATGATFAFNAASDPDALFDCRLDRPGLAGAFSPCGSPFDKSESYSGLTTNGTYTFHVRARDPSGNQDATAATWSWVVDTAAPVLTLAGGPAEGSHTQQTSPGFTIGTNEGSMTCRLNGSPVGPCSPGSIMLGPLADGAYTFTLSATDAAGNMSQVSRSFTVDTVAPAPPTITSGPSGTVSTGTASFAYTSEAFATFECALGEQTFEPCGASKEYVGLADGPHTFRVRATDRAGNTSTAAERAWTVDTAAPAAPSIGSGPSGFARSRVAAFSFTGEAGAAFLCSLDGAAAAPCTSPVAYAGLADGAHTFSVVAVDEAGNESAPALRAWTVDATKPNTILTAKPKKQTRARKATFRFRSSEMPSTFQCRLDRGAWKPCKPGKAYTKLKPGRHTFRVRAKDRAGNLDASPAAYTWTIRR